MNFEMNFEIYLPVNVRDYVVYSERFKVAFIKCIQSLEGSTSIHLTGENIQISRNRRNRIKTPDIFYGTTSMKLKKDFGKNLCCCP